MLAAFKLARLAGHLPQRSCTSSTIRPVAVVGTSSNTGYASAFARPEHQGYSAPTASTSTARAPGQAVRARRQRRQPTADHPGTAPAPWSATDGSITLRGGTGKALIAAGVLAGLSRDAIKRRAAVLCTLVPGLKDSLRSLSTEHLAELLTVETGHVMALLLEVQQRYPVVDIAAVVASHPQLLLMQLPSSADGWQRVEQRFELGMLLCAASGKPNTSPTAPTLQQVHQIVAARTAGSQQDTHSSADNAQPSGAQVLRETM